MRPGVAEFLASRRGFRLALAALFLAVAPLAGHLLGTMQAISADRQRLAVLARLGTEALLADLAVIAEGLREGRAPGAPETAAAAERLARASRGLEPALVAAHHTTLQGAATRDVRAAAAAARDDARALVRLHGRLPPDLPLSRDEAAHAGVVASALGASLDRLTGAVIRASAPATGAVGAGMLRMTLTLGLLLVFSLAAGVTGLVLLRREVAARLDRAEALRQADYLANYDSMTGAPNATQFQDRVMGALSARTGASLLVLDLNNFGVVNDRRGQVFGDVVIKEIARRVLASAESAGGFAARLGGDRFGVYVPFDAPATLTDYCRALADRCAEPVIKGGETITPGISIGAVALPRESETRALGYEPILKVANFALFAAKADNAAAFTIYDKALEEQFVDRIAMAEELPRALHGRELDVHLQPRVDLLTGAVQGFEALVRWYRNGVQVPALELVRCAEETGQIFDLDRYMLDRAIEIVAEWNRHRKTDFALSVNMSALMIQRDDSAGYVAECLARHRLPADLLTVEITETAELDGKSGVAGTVAALRGMGCRVAIDDFGTGYSSLAYLRALSADELKIDRSLVQEIDNSAEARFIVDAIMQLARILNMEVIVEGVERETQARLLLQMGCKAGQGFLYGRPRPAVDWLADATYGESQETSAA